MLTSKQTAFLRSLAHAEPAILQIGKGGISENFLDQAGLALEARELVKISVLANAEATAAQASEELRDKLHAEVVQVIGRTVVLYRRSHDNRKITLPR
ncbi:MAG: ribosome assembly RNA-binding protein YhbY [Firmicutes bacterium]|nr:ribosome assembly RNA-binding protein YhbY [Bacillota bacterium]